MTLLAHLMNTPSMLRSFELTDVVELLMNTRQSKRRRQLVLIYLMKYIDKTLGSLRQPKIRRNIGTNIRDIKSRVVEVHDRRPRYEVNPSVYRLVNVDPRALIRYEKLTNLVAINEARDEVAKILIEGSDLSKQ